jgi:hypothetical protein
LLTGACLTGTSLLALLLSLGLGIALASLLLVSPRGYLVLLFLVGKGAFLAAGASLLLLGLLWAFSFQLCPGRDPS